VDGPDPWVLDLTGARGVPPLVRVRQWVAALLAGVADDHLGVVLLVCTELVTNAYEHGRDPCRIRLQHRRVPCRVRVEVADTSPEPPTLGRSRLGDRRGRGLIIVDNLSQAWGVHSADRGKIVWAHLSCDDVDRGIPRCPDPVG
jgi:anti-sigma regulatory factor (Ser/Thr protein kinase)